MKLFSLYSLGTLLLFFGLLWMFLPHTAHATVLGPEDMTSHYMHIAEGLVVTVAGLGLMVYGERRI